MANSTSSPFTYRILFILAMAWSSCLMGQRMSPLTDFNYGNVANSQLDRIYSAGDKLYATYKNLSYRDGAGMIAEIDVETGTAIPLLGSTSTAPFALGNAGTSPTIYAVSGKTFALLKDGANGAALYHLANNGAIKLYAAPSSLYSKLVAFNGVHYFIVQHENSNNLPFLGLDTGYTLLMRTDGTAEGTVMIAELPYVPGVKILELVPSPGRLLVVTGTAKSAGASIYAPASGELAVVNDANGQPVSLVNPLKSSLSPTAPLFTYSAGAFYGFVGPADRRSGHVLRIDASGRRASDTELPLSESMPAELTRGQVLSHQQQLYLYVAADDSQPGQRFYRINPTNEATTLEELELDYSFTEETAAAAPLVTDRGILFASARESLTNLRLVTNSRLVTTSSLSNMKAKGQLYQSGPMVYLPVARSVGPSVASLDLESTRVKIIDDAIVTAPRHGGMAAAGGKLFTLSTDREMGEALTVWNPASEEATVVGHFSAVSGVDRPYIFGVDAATSSVFIRKQGNEFIYSANEGRTVPLQLAGGADNLVTYTRVIGEKIFVKGNQGPNAQMDYLLEDASLKEVRYQLDNGQEIGGKGLNVLFTLGEKMAVLSLTDAAEAIAGFSFGRLTTTENGKPRLSPIDPLFSRESTTYASYPAYVNDEYFASEFGNGPQHQYRIWDGDGDEVGTYGAAAGCKVRGISSDHVFLEAPASEGNEQRMIIFDATTGEVLKSLPMPTTDFVPEVRNTYVLGNRTVFLSASPQTGRELYVVDLAKDRVEVLADLNPGPAQSINSTRFVRIGDLLYFAANDGQSGSELYLTDGTSEGTFRVTDLNPGPASSNPTDLFAYDGHLYFTANGPAGHELYRLQSGEDEPTLLLDLNPGTDGSFPYGYTTDGKNLYFMASPGIGNPELFALPFELVSTEEPFSSQPANLYPNPVGNQPLTIEAPDGENLERVIIYDVTGREVMASSFMTGPKATVEGVGNLPAGQYWVRTFYSSGRFGLNAVVRK